jgi:hypothetical protein
LEWQSECRFTACYAVPIFICMCVCTCRPARKKRVNHGMCYTPEWGAWAGIKQRCFDPKSVSFDDYGGRGITMAPEWRDDFLAFYEHLGPRPSPAYSVDRIDVDGNYEPGNVRWATRSQQAANKRPRRRG